MGAARAPHSVLSFMLEQQQGLLQQLRPAAGSASNLRVRERVAAAAVAPRRVWRQFCQVTTIKGYE